MVSKRVKLAALLLALVFAVQFPAFAASRGIWISSAEIAKLPMSGAAWDRLKKTADSPLSSAPCLSNRNNEGVEIMAKALVYARTGVDKYRQEVAAALQASIGTHDNYSDPLAVARKVTGYAIAADLIGYSDPAFVSYMRYLLHGSISGWAGLADIHEKRPNNWGTSAGASRAAVAAYLGDTTELARCAQVFKGWLGDRASYSSFTYGDLAWQADASKPVGINPKGSTKNGYDIDGVLPDDERRAGGFTWPPPKENYVWGACDGAYVQGIILSRAGYPTWDWQDKALGRAAEWLFEVCKFPPTGDDTVILPLLDYAYGTHYWNGSVIEPGKFIGWTDWSHSIRSSVPTGPQPPTDLKITNIVP